jgi:AbrB family looped-hinge helix DNA binding protein
MEAKRLEVTRMTKKGQVVIPKAIRDRLHLEEGTPLGVVVTDKGVIMLKEIEAPFDEDDIKAIDKFWGDVESGKLKPAPVKEFLEGLKTDGTSWSKVPGYETVELGFELSKFYLSIHESGQKYGK